MSVRAHSRARRDAFDVNEFSVERRQVDLGHENRSLCRQTSSAASKLGVADFVVAGEFFGPEIPARPAARD
jgi:hypothetical protein